MNTYCDSLRVQNGKPKGHLRLNRLGIRKALAFRGGSLPIAASTGKIGGRNIMTEPEVVQRLKANGWKTSEEIVDSCVYGRVETAEFVRKLKESKDEYIKACKEAGLVSINELFEKIDNNEIDFDELFDIVCNLRYYNE